MVEACFASEDYKEGRKAFAEERTPGFKWHWRKRRMQRWFGSDPMRVACRLLLV